MKLQDKIQAKIPEWHERIDYLRKNYSDFVVGQVTIDQILNGIRGVQISISDISHVDPQAGILLRGYSIPQILDLLPKPTGGKFPMAGGLYYLLLTNEMPTQADAEEIEEEWRRRSEIPERVFSVINQMPLNTHPMTLLVQAIMALQNDSLFAQAYQEGLTRPHYWTYFLEDSLNLTAKLPGIAAYIYCRKYRDGKILSSDPNLDWSANFAHMIGKGDDTQYLDLMRLYFVLHSDHEGANVSAHTSHLVCSALSDIYLSCAAGMNGLAGPLHGLANQECIRWLLELYGKFEGLPTPVQLEGYIRQELAQGNIIPGYGHAVLRVTDPRFTAQLQFAEEHFPDDELFRLVKMVYDVAPGVMSESGKIKSPRPNVDAINGCMQFHYGVTESEFYTVLFGVSRMLGLSAHAVWSRALEKPIERPKSLTTTMLETMVGGSALTAEKN